MKIGLFGNSTYTKEAILLIQEIIADLKERNVFLFYTKELFDCLIKKNLLSENDIWFDSAKNLPDIDFAISIGGDGTILRTATYIGAKEIPILGINAGRLGFMATIQSNEVESALEEFFNKNYTIESRILVRYNDENSIFDNINYGLNDFSITKKDSASMIVIHTFIDGHFLNSYWADGLLISTPTGSTGYNLSCGGPLVMPQTNNFIIAPINPHNLNVRPMIVPDTSKLSFEVEGRAKKVLLTLDSRSKAVSTQSKFFVDKADFSVKLVKLNSNSYFNTLRNKLNWGKDARN
jgi:NAD+ kinase